MPDSPTDHPSNPQEDPTQLSSRQKYRHKPYQLALLPESSREKFNQSEPATCSQGSAEIAPIFASPRPYSMPDASLPSYHNQSPSPSTADSFSRSADRHSSASLSTPQIPFHALPRVSSNAAFSGQTMSQSDFDSNTMIPSPFCPQTPFSPMESVPLSSSSRTVDRPITRCPLFAEQPEPATSIGSSSSESSSSSNSASSYASYPTSQSSGAYPPDKQLPTMPLTSYQADSSSSSNSQACIESSLSSLPRPVSPFRAPQPPPHQQPPRTPLSQPTAMRRYMMPLHDTTSYPPPDPPIILPTENSTIMSQSSFQTQAPYFPFLSHAPPPENSWIEVETLQNEYKLHVRLPGFTREGITLATKRRRILHVVADKWENGGGHFERRISFGYDADLVQVRADFDGLMLRIMVPRRVSPIISLHTTARSTPPATVGRT